MKLLCTCEESVLATTGMTFKASMVTHPFDVHNKAESISVTWFNTWPCRGIELCKLWSQRLAVSSSLCGKCGKTAVWEPQFLTTLTVCLKSWTRTLKITESCIMGEGSTSTFLGWDWESSKQLIIIWAFIILDLDTLYPNGMNPQVLTTYWLKVL